MSIEFQRYGTEFQRYGEYCCKEFNNMVQDHGRIQLDNVGDVIIWTCRGDVGTYPMYDHAQCDKIKFCPFCGAKV